MLMGRMRVRVLLCPPPAGFNNHADFKTVFFFPHTSESSATMRAMGIELGTDEDNLRGAAVIRRAAQRRAS